MPGVCCVTKIEFFIRLHRARCGEPLQKKCRKVDSRQRRQSVYLNDTDNYYYRTDLGVALKFSRRNLWPE